MPISERPESFRVRAEAVSRLSSNAEIVVWANYARFWKCFSGSVMGGHGTPQHGWGFQVYGDISSNHGNLRGSSRVRVQIT